MLLQSTDLYIQTFEVIDKKEITASQPNFVLTFGSKSFKYCQKLKDNEIIIKKNQNILMIQNLKPVSGH